MKRKALQLLLLSAAAIVIFFSTGCKKTASDTAGNYVLTQVGDSSGNPVLILNYDMNDKLIRVAQGYNYIYDFFYNNAGNVSFRTLTSNGVVSNIDSFFYDAQNRLIEMDDYDDTLLKRSVTAFTYNADNTLNSATVDYTSPSSDNLSYSYIYSGGKLTERDDYDKYLGSYKLSYKNEFLAYDNHQNPISGVIMAYLPDAFTAAFFLVALPNNVTSYKKTTYDLTSGNATTMATTSGTYTYNSLGQPTAGAFLQTSASPQYFTFKYEKR